MKAKKQFSALALTLAACLTGSTMVTALADDKVMTENGGMVATKENYLSTPNAEITYEEGASYSLPVYLEANQPVASYEMTIEMPYFVEVNRVYTNMENDTSVFTENVNGNTVKVAYSSAYDMYNTVELFYIDYTITQEVNDMGWLYLQNCMFTTSNYEEVSVCASLGYISVSSKQIEIKAMKGDVNMDDVVDLQDIILTQQYIVGSSYFNDEQFYRADINNDGMVNILDCQYMQGYLVGRIGSLDDIFGGNQGGETDKEYQYYTLNIYDTYGKYYETTELTVPFGAEVYDYVKAYISKMGYSVEGLNVDVNGDTVNAYIHTKGDETGVYYNVQVYVEWNDGRVEDFGWISVAEGTYVCDIPTVRRYINMEGFNGSNMDLKAQVYSDMEIRLYCCVVGEKPKGYEVCIEYYCEMNGVYEQMGSSWNTYPEGESLINMVGNRDGFEVVGVYYDPAFTQEVSPEEVVKDNVTLYVKMTSIPVVGEYEVVERSYSMDGMETVDVIGMAKFTEDGVVVVTLAEEMRRGRFVNFGDEIYIELNQYAQMVMWLHNGQVEIEYYFDGSQLPETEEYQNWAGEYSIVYAQGDYSFSYGLTLYANGVFRMQNGGMFAIGMYTMEEGGIINLDIDGEAGRAQYNGDGTFTPIMGEVGGGSGDVEIGGDGMTTISGAWKCDSGNEYGIYYVEFFEDRTFKLVAESGEYHGDYYMMDMSYVALIYSVDEGYEKGMHAILRADGVMEIVDVTDGEKLEANDEMAQIAGVYSYEVYDDSGMLMISIRYDIRANGVVIGYMEQDGYAMMAMSTYEIVGEDTISIYDGETVRLDRETMTFGPVEDYGNGDIVIDKNENDYVYNENGGYGYTVVG